MLGTIRQNFRQYLLLATEPKEVSAYLDKVGEEGLPDVGREKLNCKSVDSFETPMPENSKGNVCVFCSASIRDNNYIKDGYILGKALADNGYGCVSGAGTTGVMGSVVKGSVEAGGWTGGSNVPHIIEIEGLPEGLSSFWLRPDIYTRMEIMIQRSDAFIIFPGGSGTVQEMLALLIFKQRGSDLMKDKSVIVFNRRDEKTGIRFWDKLITLLEPWCDDELFIVVDELYEIVPIVDRLLSGGAATP
jgi:uncharacterized protein (TIGR00730 family)